MNLTAENFNFIWSTFCLIAVVLSWTAQAILYNKIKKYHHGKWIAIGEPGFSTMISLDTSKFQKVRLTLKYYFGGDTELDADGRIRKLKRVNQIIFISISIIVIILIVASFILGVA